MNKYPWWLNALVLVIFLAACLLALPNIYGSVEAVQIADSDGGAYNEAKLEEFVRVVEGAGITPEATYLHDGRATTLGEAILLHGGEAQAARDAYASATLDEKSQLLQLLRSLRTPTNPAAPLLE